MTQHQIHPIRIALIGFGSIARALVQLIVGDASTGLCSVGALVRHTGAALPDGMVESQSIHQLLDAAPDVVVEAAGHEALREFGPQVLAAGVPLVILSTGALADPAVESKIRTAARVGGTHATIPSGGIGALDAIANAAQGGLDHVRLTTTKPPATLGLDSRIRTIVFDGSARDAARLYPASANVAASLALAGIGFERTAVEIVADPDCESNRHEVDAEGAFGRLHFRIDNRPSFLNPRTAAIVAMSVKASLERRGAEIVVG